MGSGRWISSLVGMCAIVAAACGDATKSGHDNVTGTNGPAGDDGAGAVAPTGDLLFALSYGDEGQQSLGGTATDDKGNVYVVGNDQQTLTVFSTPTGRQIGPQQGKSTGLFVLKYSPTGQLLWRQPFPFTGDNFARLSAVALQPTTGAVILAASLRGSMTLDDGKTLTSSNNPDYPEPVPTDNLLLIAIDTAGYLVWSRLYPSPHNAAPDRVFVTATGEIEVVGRAVDGATVGGAPFCCGADTFLARYSPTGDPIWSTAISGNFYYLGSGADADGGLVVGGGLIGTMTFDGQTFSGGGDVPGAGLLFIAGTVVRTDPQGHLRWIRVYEGPNQSTSQLNPSLDPAGNVVLFGMFEGTLDLGNQLVLEHTGDSVLQTAGLIAKLSPDGDALWAHQFPATGYDTVDGRAIAADAAGNIAFAGVVAGGLSLGGAAAPLPAGVPGAFVAKYDPDGNWLWDHGFATETSDDASRRFGVGFDAAGQVNVAAEFNNTVDFGAGPFTPPGQATSGGSALPRVPDDIFLLKLAP